jgi:hypothetical protein
VKQNRFPIDKNMLHAGGQGGAVIVSGVIGQSLWVEDG